MDGRLEWLPGGGQTFVLPFPPFRGFQCLWTSVGTAIIEQRMLCIALHVNEHMIYQSQSQTWPSGPAKSKPYSVRWMQMRRQNRRDWRRRLLRPDWHVFAGARAVVAQVVWICSELMTRRLVPRTKARNKDYISLVGREDDSPSDDVKTTAERQASQTDALRKLTGTTVPPSASSTLIHDEKPSLTPSSRTSHPLVQKKSMESVSLAAFMGGRATGPRLNRHAPQQDTHDPTQFEQRTHVAAHPIFGQGVALPGISGRGQAQVTVPATMKQPPTDREERYRPSGTPEARDRRLSTPLDHAQASAVTTAPKLSFADGEERYRPLGTHEMKDRRSSTPLVTKRHMEDMEGRSGSQKTGNRERTTSTPTVTPYANKSKSQWSSGSRPTYEPSGSNAPSFDADLSKAPTNYLWNGRNHGVNASPYISSRSFSSHQDIQSSPSSTSSTPQKPSITTPSLARPIQPDARQSAQIPRIPSQAPSPAFLRLPSQKDPTPSISRLQGRGFVKNMVKASTLLESPPIAALELENPRTRKISVLDRWQPGASPSPISPPASPKSFPMRRSQTTNPAQASPKLENGIRPLKSQPSLPSIAKLTPTLTSSSLPETSENGLGSATTMVVFKPDKPGKHVPQPSGVDELGVQHKVQGMHTPKHLASDLPLSPGKTLIHPTKDRARKPRRAKDPESRAKLSDLPLTSARSSSIPPAQSPPAMSSGRTVTWGPTTSYPADAEGASKPILSQTLRTPQDKVPAANDWLSEGRTNLSPNPMAQTTYRPAIQKDGKQRGMVGRVALPGMIVPGRANFGLRQIEATPTTSYGPRSPLASSPSEPTELCRSASPQPLPELAKQNIQHPEPVQITKTPSPFLGPAPTEKPSQAPVPGRHSRRPSTGNRATVMDVAQALIDQPLSPSLEVPTKSQVSLAATTEKAREPAKTTAVGPARILSTPPTLQAEKRKSSYEKYSSIILPPLKEEITPAPTPISTLTRTAGQSQVKEVLSPAPTLSRTAGLSFPSIVKGNEPGAQHSTEEPPITPLAEQQLMQVTDPAVHDDMTPLKVNIDALIDYQAPLVNSDRDSHMVSIDVTKITGATATAIPNDTNIFYDSEVLAIICRSKSKSSGLVATTIWGWQGKRSHMSDKEEQKFQDLAKRYGTAVMMVQQCSEPAQLVHTLGGRLVIRQGTRTHWTPENTAMHLVRSLGGVIFIDEHDLSVKNLCSAFSYCLTILEMVYVWYGSGSTSQERQAALEYAQTLSTSDAPVIELTQGENDNDEMFWVVLGDEDFAKADYWQWRRNSPLIDPRVWRVDSGHEHDSISLVHSLSNDDLLQTSTYVIDCIWELFILVGRDARGNKRDIKLALTVAMELSARVAASRPFAPTVHVLILPTQLPLDLQRNIRDLDETLLNENNVPDHMNIISSSDAFAHLQRTCWEEVALRNQTMLPLGVDVSHS